ncbi:MAG: hypothetical protein ACRDY1_08230, partial [Acidimicrobiales bacterium]
FLAAQSGPHVDGPDTAPATTAGPDAAPPDSVASTAITRAVFSAALSAAAVVPETAPATSAPPVGPDTGSLAARRDGAVDIVAGALGRLGLDPAMVDAVAAGLRHGQRLESLLLEAMAGLGDAPVLPRSAGSLLVVVGDGPAARRLGATLADDLGIDPTTVALASLETDAFTRAPGPLLVRTPAEAAERAPGWCRSSPMIVVVDAGMTAAATAWAATMIGALRPTAVWGVVEAIAKSDDIAHWGRALGGIDALALAHTDATASPAAALAAGIPVARLDGHPASAGRWVATIVDRIVPCR